jgi:hypothetical protein
MSILMALVDDNELRSQDPLAANGVVTDILGPNAASALLSRPGAQDAAWVLSAHFCVHTASLYRVSHHMGRGPWLD